MDKGTRPYYGWYITITLALTETISWGIIFYAFTVFLAPMETDLGWSRAELTGAFSLGLLVMGLAAYPVGSWVDRRGPRVIMTLGSIGASLLVIGWSLVTSLPGFYLIWAGLGVCGAAVLYDPAFTVIAQWFRRRRGTALAVVTFAAGLASTIFLPLSDALLKAFGWRPAVFILGLFLALVTIPLHALFLRRSPEALGLVPDGLTSTPQEAVSIPVNFSVREALTGRAFWFLVLGFGLSSISASAIRVHFIPFLIGAGIDSTTAAFSTGIIGVMQVVGRVAFAPLDRRLSIGNIAIGVFALQAFASALLLVGQAPVLLGLFIILFGASQGTATLTRPSIIAQLYGTSHFGRISSLLSLFLTLTSTGAPLAASLIYERFNGYDIVLWLVMILALASTIVFILANQSLRQPEKDVVMS